MTANPEPPEDIVVLRLRIAALERVAEQRYTTMQTLAHAVEALTRQRDNWKEAARFYRRCLLAMGARRIHRTWFSTQTGGTAR